MHTDRHKDMTRPRSWNSTLPVRSAPMKRTQLRRRNRVRRARLFRQQFGSPERVAWLHRQPCCACGETGDIHAHHVVSRGAGGTADDLVPMCATCHRHAHDMGRRTFEAEYDIDLAVWAEHYATTWRER